MPTTPQQAELDFDNRLPAGKEWFSVRWMARYLDRSRQHVINLIEEGEIVAAIDLRGANAKRADRSVHRIEFVAFLKRRKALSENQPQIPAK